jgi:hypothetical protein
MKRPRTTTLEGTSRQYWQDGRSMSILLAMAMRRTGPSGRFDSRRCCPVLQALAPDSSTKPTTIAGKRSPRLATTTLEDPSLSRCWEVRLNGAVNEVDEGGCNRGSCIGKGAAVVLMEFSRQSLPQRSSDERVTVFRRKAENDSVRPLRVAFPGDGRPVPPARSRQHYERRRWEACPPSQRGPPYWDGRAPWYTHWEGPS